MTRRLIALGTILMNAARSHGFQAVEQQQVLTRRFDFEMDEQDQGSNAAGSTRPLDQLEDAVARLRGASPHAPSNEAGKTADASSEKVEIALYYESMCPFCRRMISSSIAPLWRDSEFKKRIQLKLHPFGNAHSAPKEAVSEGYRFWHREFLHEDMKYVFGCQHGPQECFGNMIQACAMKLHAEYKYLPFIFCMEGYDEHATPEKSSYDCAMQHHIPMEPIRECVEGPNGNQLMLEIGEATNALEPPAGPHKYVPWVTLNGEHAEKAEWDGNENGHGNLLGLVCERLAEPRPQLCSEGNSTNY